MAVVPRVSSGASASTAAARELAADDRRPLEHDPLARPEAVEAAREERLERGGDPAGFERPVERVGGELLQEERVPLGGGDHRGARVGVERERLGELVEEVGGLLLGERSQRDRVGGPCRARVEELRAREADERDRGTLAPADQVLEQVEERRLGPVHVLEHDDDGPLSRERLEQLAGRPRHVPAVDGAGAETASTRRTAACSPSCSPSSTAWIAAPSSPSPATCPTTSASGR